MKHLNRQHTEILQILESSPYGMNSFQWRTRFIQLPVRIKEMKAMGYSIISRQNKNRSVNYILVESRYSQTPSTSQPTTEAQVPCIVESCQIEDHYKPYVKGDRKFYEHVSPIENRQRPLL